MIYSCNFVTTEFTSEMLNVSKEEVEILINQGKLKTVKTKVGIRIVYRSIIDYINEQG